MTLPIIVIGAGHNGLVAATRLARAGRRCAPRGGATWLAVSERENALPTVSQRTVFCMMRRVSVNRWFKSSIWRVLVCNIEPRGAEHSTVR